MLKMSLCKLYFGFWLLLLTVSSIIADEAAELEKKTIKSEVHRGIYELSYKLYKLFQDEEPGKNTLIAPITIYGALSLAWLGADGDTSAELAQILGLQSYNKVPKDDINEIIGGYIKKSQTLQHANLSIAQAVFLQNDLNLVSSYESKCKLYYDSEVSRVDFKLAGEAATQAINDWVCKSTKNKIHKLYETTVDQDTKVIVASALHLEAKWEYPFPEAITKDYEFHGGINGDQVVTIKGMNNMKVIPYFRDLDLHYEAFALPYENEEAFMYYVIPCHQQTLSNLTKYATAADIKRMIENNKTAYVDYTVPRIKFEFQKDLANYFVKLGAKTAFSAAANFANLAPGLQLKQVIHKTQMEINEQGTYAAAVTTVAMFPMSMPIKVTVNKPFAFFAFNTVTKGFIFSGSIFNPSQL